MARGVHFGAPALPVSAAVGEPGGRLGRRYRIEDRIGGGDGWAAWKATDETLARAVTLVTFARGFPRLRSVVAAARASSRLTDPRLARVFDLEESRAPACVVTEWVCGDSLDELLANGPLDPCQAAGILAECAAALASAHAAGVPHLCLTPRSVRWTADGGVKIAGLGIDAAVAGVSVTDPARADARGLGMLLYAALTAHWPGGQWPDLPAAPGLPAAPESGGHPLSPRQVLSGVPAGIDSVARQALSLPGHGGPSLTTPAMFASALDEALPGFTRRG